MKAAFNKGNPGLRETKLGKSLIWAGEESLSELAKWLIHQDFSSIVVLADEHTSKFCLPRLEKHLQKVPAFKKSGTLVKIPAGEKHKTFETCQLVWEHFFSMGLDRKSLVINLGGGMVGDLGGFSSACFKRGISFVQVPTTLLAQVDAGIGGKTGIDLGAYKNQIGLIVSPEVICVDPVFLETLPARELRSGFAEVLKHALIRDETAWNILSRFSSATDLTSDLIWDSMQVKITIVAQDPQEKNVRKALNFGHTVGHALESYFLQKHPENPLLHGEAVAAGMVCEAWVSYQAGYLSTEQLYGISSTVLRLYGKIAFQPEEMENLRDFVMQDKKNENGRILLSLLDGIGNSRENCPASFEVITQSLRFYLSQS